MTVKAIIARGGSGQRTIEFADREVPTVGDLDVLVRPRLVGVCGTDLELLGGHLDGFYDVKPDVVLGHEWVGEVIEIGPGVDGLVPGDRVTSHGFFGPGRWLGNSEDGVLAERLVLPTRILFAVPDELSDEVAVLIEPLACAAQALTRIPNLAERKSAAILGCGLIGLAMTSLLAAQGIDVTAIDLDERRGALAVDLGARRSVTPAAAAAEAESTETGFDLIVEASGAPAAQALAFDIAGVNGHLVFMGITHTKAPSVALYAIQALDLTVAASSGAPPEIWPQAIQFLKDTDLDFSSLIGDTFEFAEGATAFRAAGLRNHPGKVMIRVSSEHP